MAVSLAQWSSGLPSPFEPCPHIPSASSSNTDYYEPEPEWAMPSPKRHQTAPISSPSFSVYDDEPFFSMPVWQETPDSTIAQRRQQQQPQSVRYQQYQASPRELYGSPTHSNFYEHAPTQRQESGSSTLTIEPDPLPPHSSPHTLTATQSQAYSRNSHLAPVRFGTEKVWSSNTGFPEYTITRDTSNLPSFLSTKPILTVRRASTGLPVATIRFHNLTSNDIEVTVNGRETSLANTGFLHKRWTFTPTTTTTTLPSHGAERWIWKKDRQTGGAVLEDAKKHGRVLARMKADQLTPERAGLSNESYDEIVISAIAMVEAARRASRGRDLLDLAGAVGDLASPSDRSSAREGSASP
nr:hypothetical protein CFP56_10252 [Quercus suber]